MASPLNRLGPLSDAAKIDTSSIDKAKVRDSQKPKKARPKSMASAAGHAEIAAGPVLRKPRPKSVNVVNVVGDLRSNPGLHNDAAIPAGRKTTAATHEMVSHTVRNPANAPVQATIPRDWHPAPPPPDMGAAPPPPDMGAAPPPPDMGPAPPPPPPGPIDPAAVAALGAPQAQDTLETLKVQMKDLLTRTNELRADVTKFQDKMTQKASYNDADGDMTSPKAQFTVDQTKLKVHQDEIRACVKQLYEINEKFQKLENLTHSPDVQEILNDVRLVKINLNATRKILNDIGYYNNTQKLFDFFNQIGKILETMNAQIDEILHSPGLQPHFPDI